MAPEASAMMAVSDKKVRGGGEKETRRASPRIKSSTGKGQHSLLPSRPQPEVREEMLSIRQQKREGECDSGLQDRVAYALLVKTVQKSGVMGLYTLNRDALDINLQDESSSKLRDRKSLQATTIEVPTNIQLPIAEIEVRDSKESKEGSVSLLPNFSADSLDINPLWEVKEGLEAIVTSKGLACTKAQNSLCIFLVIATRFKFFRLRLDYLPLRHLPEATTGAVFVFAWCCDYALQLELPAYTKRLKSVLEGLSSIRCLSTPNPTEAFVERFKILFASVRSASYTVVEGLVCSKCLEGLPSKGERRIPAKITGETKRLNVAEYPPWTRVHRSTKAATMSELVQTIFSPNPSAALGVKLQCPYPTCKGENLRNIIFIRDRLPLLLTLGTTIITALRKTPTISFRDDISIQYCHESCSSGYANITYGWLGAVYLVHQQYQLVQNSHTTDHVFLWTGEQQGDWRLCGQHELPPVKNIVALFYWQKGVV